MAFISHQKKRLCQESLLRQRLFSSPILVNSIFYFHIEIILSFSFLLGNPTGTVFRREEVELLVKIAKDRNLFLLGDEPYREYAFDSPAVSLLSYMQVSTFWTKE